MVKPPIIHRICRFLETLKMLHVPISRPGYGVCASIEPLLDKLTGFSKCPDLARESPTQLLVIRLLIISRNNFAQVVNIRHDSIMITARKKGVAAKQRREKVNEMDHISLTDLSPKLSFIHHIQRQMDRKRSKPSGARGVIHCRTAAECFQHLVESMPRRIKAVLKATGGPTSD